ncbi:MAG: hypothetical protein KJN90_11175, partial [Gammaproteobacteria bacterium]|nr:hypothetical protein [Gammaproteobacteria bacterium]
MASEVLQHYQQAHSLSISNPDEFWGNAARQLSWSKPWDKVLDTSQTAHGHWFSG